MASTSAPLKTIEERIMDAWYQEKANNNYDSDDESDSDSDSSSIVLSASVSQTYTYKDNNNEVDIGGSHELVGASEPRAFSDRFGTTNVEEFPDGILDSQFGDDVEVWPDGFANAMAYPNLEDGSGNDTCASDGGLEGNGDDGDSDDVSARPAEVQMSSSQVPYEAPVKDKLDTKSDSPTPTCQHGPASEPSLVNANNRSSTSNELEEGEPDEPRRVTVAEKVSKQPQGSALGAKSRGRHESGADASRLGKPPVGILTTSSRSASRRDSQLEAKEPNIAKTPAGVASTVTKENNDLPTSISLSAAPPAKRSKPIPQDYPQGTPLPPSNPFPKFKKNKDASSSRSGTGATKTTSAANTQRASEGGIKIKNQKAPANSSVKEVPMTIPKKERPKMIASSSSYITASTPRGQKRALPVEDENPPEDEIYCGWKDCKTTRSFPSVYAVITHVKDVHRVGRDKNGKHRCMWRGCDARVIDLGKHLRGSGRNDAHAVLSTILKQDQKKKAKLGF